MDNISMISMCSHTLYMSDMDGGSLSASTMTYTHIITSDPEPQNLIQVVWVKLCNNNNNKAADVFNGQHINVLDNVVYV